MQRASRDVTASSQRPAVSNKPVSSSSRDMFYSLPTNGGDFPRKNSDGGAVSTAPSNTTLQTADTVKQQSTPKNSLFDPGEIIPSTSTPLPATDDNGFRGQRRFRSKNDVRPDLVKEPAPVIKSPDGYVGFATLPDQLHRRAVKKGFSFNLMVVGESGLGKSTFINSLFLKDIYKGEKENQPQARGDLKVQKTVTVRTNKIRLTENLVSLDLTLIDTPGFGDSLDNSGCWEPIVSFIDEKYEEYLNAETRVDRVLPIVDNRVHCCLYFISPNGHGLRSIDIELMRRLCAKVNIIPLIAKADTLTSEELKRFKHTIREDLAREQINVFDFGECPAGNSDQRGVTALVNGGVGQKRTPPHLFSPPFAVVGSNCIVEKDGVFIRGRQYPWGFVNVESTDHCDFIPLRKLLIRTHMCDLKEKTHRIHYEAYRTRRLCTVYSDTNVPVTERTLLSQIEEDNGHYEEHLKRMEAEMQEVFDAKVAEKVQKLEESRENVRKTYENYKKAIDEEAKRIETRRAEFEKEKSSEMDYVSMKSETSSSAQGKQRKSLF